MTSQAAARQRVDVDAYLSACRHEIETALDRWLPRPPECPRYLADAMRYSVFAGGKRLRPILALAGADTVAVSQANALKPLVLPSACAIEMIHTYSLIHDDLPSMDNDVLRRGQPTSHVAFGEGLAVLAGDALLTEAFHLLACRPDADQPDIVARKLDVTGRIAAAAGALGMVGGQVIDLHAAGQTTVPAGSGAAPAVLDAAGLRAMHARKTGALFRVSGVAGAIMAGASADQRDAIDAYGGHVGLAFQIIDDILDVEGGDDAIGKTAGKDAAAGKPTYPSMFGVDRSRDLAADEIEHAKAALARAGLSGRLGSIADWILSRSH